MTNRARKLGIEHVLFARVHFNRYRALLGQTQSRFKTFCNSLAQCIARGRFGGGRAGNLAPGSLSEIAATLVNGQRAPAMKVHQPLAMDGGEDAETLPQAERRIPATLRHQQRAVTADDFKRLALETPAADVGRVEVMPRFKPRDRRFHVPGVVSVVVLPSAAPTENQSLPFLLMSTNVSSMSGPISKMCRSASLLPLPVSLLSMNRSTMLPPSDATRPTIM